MPRNILEDIKPITKNGAKSAVKAKKAAIEEKEEPVIVHDEPIVERSSRMGKPIDFRAASSEPFRPETPHRAGGHALWWIAAVFVIALVFSLSFLFESASVTVVPKTVPIELDASDVFTAKKDSIDSADIVFTETTDSADISDTFPATGQKTLSESASGALMLYNAYNTQSYKLAAGTRLVTADKRTYKLVSAVVIPGLKKQADGTIVPGSAEGRAIAIEPGEAGNFEHADFSIPGLAGTARAGKIYGRSKSAFTGGIIGTMYYISEDTAQAAYDSLKSDLKEALMKKVKFNTKEGWLVYEGAMKIVTDDAVSTIYSKTAEVPISLHGTMTVYLINEDSLEKAIAKKFSSQYDGEPINVPVLGDMPLTPTAPLSPDTDTTFSFTLSGNGSVIWTVDPATIKTLLAGKKKSEFDSLMSSVAGVDKADTVIKPFWKRSFPEKSEKIQVVIQK